MSFRLVPKSVTLHDLERRNGPYFAFFHRTRQLSERISGWRRGVVVTELVVSTKLLYAEPG